MFNKIMILRFSKFIAERHKIYLRKEQGLPRPWTGDKILQQYRFCNVYRELDTVTQWIAKNWRGPNETDKNLWFAMVIARLVNWPDTLARMTYKIASPWKPVMFQHIIRDIQESGGKAYSGAYIVSTNGRKMLKEKYLAEQVLTPLWEARGNVYLLPNEPLYALHNRLSEFQGMGSFMSAQVIADVKYIPALRKAPDWWTFAASGPGSRRGLNRMIMQPVDHPWKEHEWHVCLMKLATLIKPLIIGHKMKPLHNQDLQNCLCEFDKYERVRLGQGKPRSSYPGVEQ